MASWEFRGARRQDIAEPRHHSIVRRDRRVRNRAAEISRAAKPKLLSLLIRHEQTVYAQAQQSAACLATHQVEARLCRWLLRARDLAGSDDLPFTQEYLAEMLGVRRTSVTEVAQTLQEAGLIKYARGKIQIVDATALQESACECYGSVQGFYRKLLGTPPDNLLRLMSPTGLSDILRHHRTVLGFCR